LKSDLIGDIIQEIDAAADKTAAKVAVTKDPSIANDVDVKNILENVENYEDFTKLMAEKTTNQVVEQMKNVLKDSNAAPTFDGDELDNKLGEGTKKMSTNDSVNESSIMKIYSTIIYESYVDGQPTISSDMGMEMAFIEYCIDQLDHAFMATPKRPLMARYR
jgi:CRISPR/Cas system CMR-associated protein Cmr5 small subunit